MVLADVSLAKTTGTYFYLKPLTFQVGTNSYDYIDRKASPSDIAGEINIPHFQDLIDKFLQHQLELQPFEHLDLGSNITIYTSAIAVFCAPSDICSIHGMAKE